jgi:hypothetical protein
MVQLHMQEVSTFKQADYGNHSEIPNAAVLQIVVDTGL